MRSSLPFATLLIGFVLVTFGLMWHFVLPNVPRNHVPLPFERPTPLTDSGRLPPPTPTQTLTPEPAALTTQLSEATPVYRTPNTEYRIPTAEHQTPPTTLPPTFNPRPSSPTQRLGIAGTAYLSEASALGLDPPHLIDWWARAGGDRRRWQMVRVSESGPALTNADLAAILTMPGETGRVWLIGNEMDVLIQDNVTPERYAEIYHQLYTEIKRLDSTAQVMIGGVSQPTPLRRTYLDRVLDYYEVRYGEPLPTDGFNVHAFLLREEAGSWGAGIPTGLTGTEAEPLLIELPQHIDFELWQAQLIDFRGWMAARGYGEQPLYVTEYGVIMPADLGFPPEQVADFLAQTAHFFANASGPHGYGPDDKRLVQLAFWYSIYDSGELSAGNLYDPDTGQLTLVGERYLQVTSDEKMMNDER